MAVVSRAELVKSGVETLKEAERAVAGAMFREAEIQVGIARAYAELADALGDKRVNLRNATLPNW